MQIFGNFGDGAKGRGCFMRFPESGSSGITNGYNHAVKIIWPDGNTASATGTAPYLVTGVEWGQKEKFSLVECFGGVTHTYAFGHDPKSSLLQVSIMGFLTASNGTSPSTIVQQANYAYRNYRLAAAKKYTKIVISNSTLYGFLVGMQSATVNQEINLQQITFTFIVVGVLE